MSAQRGRERQHGWGKGSSGSLPCCATSADVHVWYRVHRPRACVDAQRRRMLDGDWRKARGRRCCQQQVRRQRACASASCVRASAGTVRRRSFEFSQRVMIDGRHVEETGRKGIVASTAQRGLLCAFSPGQNEEPEAKRSLGPSCYEERVERETGCSECRSSRAGFQKAGWPV